jgi:hypothetical protein
MLSPELKNLIKASVKMETLLMETGCRLSFPAEGTLADKHPEVVKAFWPKIRVEDGNLALAEPLVAAVATWTAHKLAFAEGYPFNAPTRAWLKEQGPEVAAYAKDLSGLQGMLLRLDRKLGRCHGDVFSYTNLLTGENGILAEGIGGEASRNGELKAGNVLLGAVYRTGPITMAVILSPVPAEQTERVRSAFEALADPCDAADYVAAKYPEARLELLRLEASDRLPVAPHRLGAEEAAGLGINLDDHAGGDASDRDPAIGMEGERHADILELADIAVDQAHALVDRLLVGGGHHGDIEGKAADVEGDTVLAQDELTSIAEIAWADGFHGHVRG